MIPMQMIVSRYVEASLDDTTRQRLRQLIPHTFQAKSNFLPYDKVPREYSFVVADGLNIGGVKYDETRLGGPKGDVTQFVPGVIQWDSGRHGGGVGWISVGVTMTCQTDHEVWPTSVRADITAADTTLNVSFPANAAPESLVLRISSLPFFQLDKKSWSSDLEELPGLRVELSGNIAQAAKRTLLFDKTTTQHDAKYYELTFDLTDMEKGEKLELALQCERTSPPQYPFRW
jgi:hypothetical protein